MSVVIPAYNAAPYVALTIESVIAQTYTSWELIVLDDGSTDATAAIAESFGEIDDRVRVMRGHNAGVAAARNRGFAATDPGTEFVIFLDNDDVWRPDTLEVLVGVLDAQPHLVSAHSLATSLDGRGNRPSGDDLDERLRERRILEDGRVRMLRVDESTSFAALTYRNCILTPGLHLLRRDVFQTIGGFRARAVPADDWDMAIRMSRRGDIAFANVALLHWRRHDAAQSNRSAGWRHAQRWVRSEMITDPGNTPDQLRLAIEGYRSAYRETIRGARDLPRGQHLAAARQVARGAIEFAHYVGTRCRSRLRRWTAPA